MCLLHVLELVIHNLVMGPFFLRKRRWLLHARQRKTSLMHGFRRRRIQSCLAKSFVIFMAIDNALLENRAWMHEISRDESWPGL